MMNVKCALWLTALSSMSFKKVTFILIVQTHLLFHWISEGGAAAQLNTLFPCLVQCFCQFVQNYTWGDHIRGNGCIQCECFDGLPWQRWIADCIQWFSLTNIQTTALKLLNIAPQLMVNFQLAAKPSDAEKRTHWILNCAHLVGINITGWLGVAILCFRLWFSTVSHMEKSLDKSPLQGPITWLDFFYVFLQRRGKETFSWAAHTVHWHHWPLTCLLLRQDRGRVLVYFSKGQAGVEVHG